MAQAPVNYSIGTPSVAQQFRQGIQTGSALEQLSNQREDRADAKAAERAKAQAMMADRQAYQADLKTILQGGRAPTSKDFGTMMAKYPALTANLKQSWEVMDKGQQQETLSSATRSYAALTSGNTDIAVKALRSEAEALRQAGREKEADSREAIAKTAELSPDQARAMMAPILASVMGPENFSKAFGKLGEEQRASALAPAKQRIATAKSLEAMASAKIKEAEAVLAPEAFGAAIGLTEAQIAQAKAAAANLRASAKMTGIKGELAKLQAEHSAAGTIPPDKRPEAERRMREEYAKSTKQYAAVQRAYDRMRTVEDTGAGDLALVFSFMKTLDPGSAVRESEFANAENAAGLPEKVRAAYKKIVGGGRLSSTQRKQFLSQGRELYGAAKKSESRVRKGLARIARGYGLKTENVFIIQGEEQETPQAPVAPVAPPGAPQGQSNAQQRNIVVDF